MLGLLHQQQSRATILNTRCTLRGPMPKRLSFSSSPAHLNRTPRQTATALVQAGTAKQQPAHRSKRAYNRTLATAIAKPRSMQPSCALRTCRKRTAKRSGVSGNDKRSEPLTMLRMELVLVLLRTRIAQRLPSEIRLLGKLYIEFKLSAISCNHSINWKMRPLQLTSLHCRCMYNNRASAVCRQRCQSWSRRLLNSSVL